MGILDKVKELFAEDESWKEKEPITHEGKRFGAWDPDADPRAAWPNAQCAKCGGTMLKKELYWNRETDTWYHRECLKG